jgi:actin-like protein 6A
MYCGDETGSFIGDVGSHTCRFGYGGEDNPKFVAPSYMVQVDDDDDNDVKTTATKKCHIPTTCYQGRLASQNVRPIMRMPWSGGSSSKGETSDAANLQQLLAAPQIDPNAYLQQGDSIQDWEALEQMWLTSFDVLRVTDTRKHTTGGTPYDNDNKSDISKVQSSTVRGGDASSKGGGRCVHPILAVTPGMTHCILGSGEKHAAAIQREQHNKLTEFLMETMEAPAVFLAPTPMLSSFCFGRQTSLVVDIGASGCRVTPVVDGLLLKHAQRRNGRGGDWLGNVQWRALLEEKIVVRPRYQLRKAVSAMATKSPYLYRWAMQDLMYEFRTSEHIKLTQWCVDESVPLLSSRRSSPPHASTSSDDEEEDGEDNKEGENSDAMDVDENQDDDSKGKSADFGSSTYELPDGTHIDLSSQTGKDLCRIPELLFTNEVPYVMDETARTGIMSEHHTLCNLPLHHLIFASLSAVGDGDIRKDLAANIILTGGSSLFPNLPERLSMEVPRLVPNTYKCRVIASRNSVERSCSAWVGASILTSLGSFQQLWLSRAEYDEYGSAISIQRFP